MVGNNHGKEYQKENDQFSEIKTRVLNAHNKTKHVVILATTSNLSEFTG